MRALPLCALLLLACASAPASRRGELPAALTVRGPWILSANGPFAQVRLLATDGSGRLHRGAALFYAAEEREVWICPEEGWALSPGAPAEVAALERGWAARRVTDLFLGDRRAERADEVGTWCGDVEISADGRTVGYERRGLLGREHRTFDVGARASDRRGEPGLR